MHRQVKYLDDVIEADHRKLKQPTGSVRDFKTLKTVCATIMGLTIMVFEVMRALRTGQAAPFNVPQDICGEAHCRECALGIGPRRAR